MTHARVMPTFDLSKGLDVLRINDEASIYGWALEIARSIPLDSAQAFLQIIQPRIRLTFEMNNASQDLDKLEKYGVQPEALFLVLMAFVFLPSFDEASKKMFGDLKERERKAKALKKAAAIMHEVAGEEGVNDEFDRTLERIGVPSPRRIAHSLEQYSQFLFLRERLLELLNANSGLEIAKYTAASAIHRITGKYRDREVSAVVGVFQRDPAYDETAHRVWRIRTLPRLDPTAAVFPIIVHALNTALTELRRLHSERTNS
jgi:hypothetical protein